jgi:16S rRNA (cytosine1402-N4)-methyltransferase
MYFLQETFFWYTYRMEYVHEPVLLKEVLSALQIKKDANYIDCTFGGGGYSRAIADRGGKVLGLDVDEDAVSNFEGSRTEGIVVVRSNFENVYEIAEKQQFLPAHGVVFDLGVSSFQIDNPDKGFSFLKKGPIDMRMDTRSGMRAGELLDVLDERSMMELFQKFGDEMHSKKIARAIVEERKKGEGGKYWEEKTTTELAYFIEQAVGGRKERIHPATRVFQALRMAVNDEAGALERGLKGALECLESKGRIVVVSFHSVEDRIVKMFMNEYEKLRYGRQIGDIITPGEEEILRNPRSRSAKMRIFQKS